MYAGAFEQVNIGQESKYIYAFSDLLPFLCSSKPCLLSDTLKETGDRKNEEEYIIQSKASCQNCTVFHSAVHITRNS